MLELIVLGGGIALVLIGLALDWFDVAPVLSNWLMFGPPVAFCLFLLLMKITGKKRRRQRK